MTGGTACSAVQRRALLRTSPQARLSGCIFKLCSSPLKLTPPRQRTSPATTPTGASHSPLWIAQHHDQLHTGGMYPRRLASRPRHLSAIVRPGDTEPSHPVPARLLPLTRNGSRDFQTSRGNIAAGPRYDNMITIAASVPLICAQNPLAAHATLPSPLPPLAEREASTRSVACITGGASSGAGTTGGANTGAGTTGGASAGAGIAGGASTGASGGGGASASAAVAT